MPQFTVTNLAAIPVRNHSPLRAATAAPRPRGRRGPCPQRLVVRCAAVDWGSPRPSPHRRMGPRTNSRQVAHSSTASPERSQAPVPQFTVTNLAAIPVRNHSPLRAATAAPRPRGRRGPCPQRLAVRCAAVDWGSPKPSPHRRMEPRTNSRQVAHSSTASPERSQAPVPQFTVTNLAASLCGIIPLCAPPRPRPDRAAVEGLALKGSPSAVRPSTGVPPNPHRTVAWNRERTAAKLLTAALRHQRGRKLPCRSSL